MLIDPTTLVQYAVPVLILTLVTIFGQSISSTIGALISGQPLKQSVQTGMSLSQIGEFSFIIATWNDNECNKFLLYPVVVAVSAVTTFTTPFMVKLAIPFSEYLEKILPRKWTKRIERYSSNAQAIRSVTLGRVVIRTHLLHIILHTIIITSIILMSSKYILP
jgi:CPA2 family monovalent cation:H+ antiporter-2